MANPDSDIPVARVLPIADRKRAEVDTTFDFRSDAGSGDPDKHSPTLRRYHKLLWSKRLPNGKFFDLDDSDPRRYLYHHSELGEFLLTSDSVIATLTRRKNLKPITDQVGEELNGEFRYLSYTIGGMLVFPGNQIEGKQTIKTARGFSQAISDRLDLTLESIRRYYLGEESPLAGALARYDRFFRLFEDFAGYTDFFLLQDAIDDDASTIRFCMPFDDFHGPSVPTSLSSYLEYRSRSIEFIHARNRRIERYLRKS